MRLIDRDSILGCAKYTKIDKNFEPYITIDDLAELLDEQPTAYEIGKVIKELDSLRITGNSLKFDLIPYNKAIEIVKQGGATKNCKEQGLLLRLPCKVGDTVWRIIISDNYIMPCNVEEFVYSNSLYIIVREELFNTRRGLNIDEIGNSVFLTQAEAEQKLKEMESD